MAASRPARPAPMSMTSTSPCERRTVWTANAGEEADDARGASARRCSRRIRCRACVWSSRRYRDGVLRRPSRRPRCDRARHDQGRAIGVLHGRRLCPGEWAHRCLRGSERRRRHLYPAGCRRGAGLGDPAALFDLRYAGRPARPRRPDRAGPGEPLSAGNQMEHTSQLARRRWRKRPDARSAWLPRAGPGRPILSLPTDVLEGDTPDSSVYGVPEFGAAPAMRIVPDQALVERAAAELAAATRPVIVAGGGVLTSGAWNELTLLAETLNIPVATSINGKGSIAGDERCRDRRHRRQRSAAVRECLPGRRRSRALRRITDRLDDDVPLDAAADRQRAESHSGRRRAVRSREQLPPGRRSHRRRQTDPRRASRGDRSA